MKSQEQKLKQAAKFLHYVLGHRPDEFGLIPDDQGFVAVKTLLRAVNEEEGWRFLRLGDLQQIVLNLRPAPLELDGQRVRAANRELLPSAAAASELPKILHTAVRQRAYPVVLEKGIRPTGGPSIVLSQDENMARRLGLRFDNHPIIVTVQSAASLDAGVIYRKYGEMLYLADFIPIGVFSGPPLPRETTRPAKPKALEVPTTPKTPGSYFPDLTGASAPSGKERDPKKKKDWQVERRRARKRKTQDYF